MFPAKRAQIVGLAGWLLVVFLAAGLGAVASIDAQEFYAQLVKPGWAPPAAVFGPVWTTLYTMMALAAWLVWRSGGFGRHGVVLIVFLVQLAVNALWSWFFFAWQRGALAFVEVVVLWVLVAGTVVGFWRAKPLAGALLVPYLLWVSFASALTWSVWQLNPQLL